MTQHFQDIMVYFEHHFTFDINFGLIMASRLVCSWIRLLRTSQHFQIQHSTSLLHLQSVGLSRFLHLTCKFSLFYTIPFPPLPCYDFSSFPSLCIMFLILVSSLLSFTCFIPSPYSLLQYMSYPLYSSTQPRAAIPLFLSYMFHLYLSFHSSK